MRKYAMIVLAFIAFFFVFICTALAVDEDGVQCNAKIDFTLDELVEDYDQLWNDLKVNYPFLPVLESRGIDVERLCFTNRTQLTTRISDLMGFVSLIQNMFSQMDNLAHLSLVDVELFDFYNSFLPVENDPRNELVINWQTQAVYSFLKEKYKPSASVDSTKVEIRYFSDVNVVYFHFKSFDHLLVDRDKGIVADYLSSFDNVEHIIFDITGNPGGDTTYWEKNIVLPFGGEYEWKIDTFLKKTPVNERYFFTNDHYKLKPLSALPSDYEMPSFVQKLELDYYYAGNWTFLEQNDTGKSIKSKAKRWVLIDQATFSAADGFAAFCKSSGWATLVGKTTYGDGADEFGPVMFKLKNTGLLVRFSSASCANSDGTMNAEIGTSPDIICKVRETPLETCLRVIGDMQ